MNDCIFCKIGKHEIPAKFLYEDDDVMVFPDIHPRKEKHVLVVPKKHIIDFMGLDDATAVKLKNAIQDTIKKLDLDTKGFQLEVNGGGYQIVDHLHVHIMGPFSKPQQQ